MIGWPGWFRRQRPVDRWYRTDAEVLEAPAVVTLDAPAVEPIRPLPALVLAPPPPFHARGAAHGFQIVHEPKV